MATAAPPLPRARVPHLDVGAGYRELRGEIDAAVARVLASGRYILGEEVEAFEAEWAAACATSHAIGVNSGLDALTLALRALGVGRGHEVVVPAHTFIATWLAVSAVGATPVAADVDGRTGNLDPAAAARSIGPRTGAVVAVHLYGRPADVAALRALGPPLIEDAAQAHLASAAGRPAGGLGRAGAFSFYPGKNLGAFGDAGAVTTDDDVLADEIRLLRNYGSRAKYAHDVPGVNSRLDPIQAAILRVKLRHLAAWNRRRAQIAARYRDGLTGLPGLTLPAPDGPDSPAWHLFVVRHARRDALAAALAADGIETLVHYPVAPHRSGAYRAAATGAMPEAEAWCRECLSLPIGPHLRDADVEAVVAAVRRCCG